MRSIEHDIEFLDEMMDWWEYAGLGRLEYDVDPNFHVRVGLNHPPVDDQMRFQCGRWMTALSRCIICEIFKDTHVAIRG